MFGQHKNTGHMENISNINWRGLFTPKRIIIALLILVFIFARFFITLKLDLTWFDVLGYGSVFWRNFYAKLTIGGAIFIAAFVLNMANMILIFRLAKKPLKKMVAVPVALFTAAIVVGNSGELWLAILRTFNAVPFGLADPQFGIDIGFYVFRMPIYWLLYRLVTTWLVVNLIVAVGFYILLLPRNVEITAQNITSRIITIVEKRGISHVGVLLGLLIAFQAVQYKLASYELLYSQTGSVIGAGAADIGARMPAYFIMMVLALLVGGFIVVTFRKRIKTALFSILVFFICSVVITGVYPSLYQKFVVDPEELERELPYLERNIEYTRLAYGLDDMKEEEYPIGELTLKDIEENDEIISNIRLLDHRATNSTFAQQQEIRSYFDFIDVDSDRYLIDGKLTHVMISAREMNQKALSEQAQNFNNQMFKYTHGFGLAMSPANAITSTGLPEYFIKDIPPQSTVFKVKEPRIYYGESTNENVIVKTGLLEFDYPEGNDNQEYYYEGNKGIPMTFLNRVLFAMRDVQFKYLLSSYITSESLYLETRGIKERAYRIAPFLLYDGDPYLVLGEDGKLYYMMDAYTTTERYPYSQAIESRRYNYLRNSVKVIIDAYSGDIDFYIFDEDPIIKVYDNIYPELFKEAAEMPADLKKHVRYPVDLLNVQSVMLRDYHMSNPTVFYNREDRWEIAQENYAGKQITQEPYYSIIRLPGEEKSEFVLMRAFTPIRKQNMVAWLAGRSDGDNYGKLLLYKFPKGEQVQGTNQVESLIDQDPTISGQLSLWAQGGSNVIRGNLLVYPIADSLLYVEPLYIESEQNKYPQLKKVFVLYQDKIVMEDNLEQALAVLFGESTKDRDDTKPPTIIDINEDPDGILKRLVDLNRQAMEKLKEGDWETFGSLQKEIDDLLNFWEGNQQEAVSSENGEPETGAQE